MPVKRGEMAERRKVLEREGARVIEVEGENGVFIWLGGHDAH